ncbi:helicase domain protein [Nitzschia inconspicua]|uniref:Helicase domain protein n=1 Tax=Nitzschia inconspicua TaxID=303405 RepID=A0A9K3M467_9STRA|nr:helicase domain protein [Nitzschia inconspicua]
MDPIILLNTHCIDPPDGFSQDIESLLYFLNKAEVVATSISFTSMAPKKCHSNLDAFESTPIRPHHEQVTIRKQDSFVTGTHNHQLILHPEGKTSDPICASAGSSFSEVSSIMDDDPFNLEEPEKLQKGLAFLPNGQFSTDSATTSYSSPSIRLSDYHTSQWGSRFKELLLFQQEHGHLLVPYFYLPNSKLSQWVKRQRHQYKRKHMGHHSTLTDEREELLLEIGFIFDSHRAICQMRFETLTAYYLAYGRCQLPANSKDCSLNVWIKHQRRQYILSIKGKRVA